MRFLNASICGSGARNREHGDIALCEMNDSAVEVIGEIRAAWAALLPFRTKHEVVDDQLAATVEQIGQRFLASGPFEQIGLVYFDPRQFATLPAQFVAGVSESLFSFQERFARGEPFRLRYDLVRLHDTLLRLAII